VACYAIAIAITAASCKKKQSQLRYEPFLPVPTAELVSDLRSATLPQQYLDDASVVVVV